MGHYWADTLITWLAVAMLLASIIGYSCATARPAACLGSCSDSPCLSDIGCGFDCVCLKFGSDRQGVCARSDW